GRDVVYVNEVPVGDPKDVVEEVAASMSEGVGITGGDPLLTLERVEEYVKLLKEVFGSRFHVHLYTTGTALSRGSLERLVSAGLDELRVHVVSSRSLDAVGVALEYPVDVVVENPAIPGREEFLKSLVKRLDSMGVRYVNLNELEVSESNLDSLVLRGLRPSSSGRSVEGSRDVAVKLIEWVEESGLGISVHYCPAVYKDAYQYPRRLARRALSTRRFFEVVDGGVVRWVEVGGVDLRDVWLAGAVVRLGDRYLAPLRLAEVLGFGTVVEALPTTPRRVLNEYSWCRH
ncbi:MAG: radical SAM protein, partial [Sulfolobales archaeon]|nr:radical SAM protein [Sulfolobales archaeon]